MIILPKNKVVNVPRGFFDNPPEKAQKIWDAEEVEIQKDFLKEQTKHHKILGDVVDRSNTVLFHAKAVWPFDFFPNEIVIDMARVTIVKREFLISGNVESLYIKDLMHITVETGPFFATLRLVDTSFDLAKHFIEYLRKKDAFRARDVLQGLVTAVKGGVDLSRVDVGQIVPSITDLSGKQFTPAI